MTDYPTLQSQSERYKNLGFESCQSIDMNQVWDVVSNEEKLRVTRLEILDEVEELQMIQAHYCLTFASRLEDLDLWIQ